MQLSKSLLAAAIASSLVSTTALAAVEAKFSGQVNRGVLAYSDGEETEVRHVDNDASSTRFRFTGSNTVDTTKVGITFELEAESNNTRRLSQGPTNSALNFAERVLEFYVQDSWGKLSVGQGATASDGTSEKDLSGTALAGWSDVATHAGGLKFRVSGDTSTIPSGPSLSSTTSNYDGASRNDRIRYDSPSMSGLTVSVSHIDSADIDLGLHYSGKYDGLKVVGGLGFVSYDSGAFDNQINGSVSVAMDSGFNVTVAAGSRARSGAGDDPSFAYVKGGYKMGDNKFSVDYQVSDEVSAGREVTSVGAQFARTIKPLSLETYVGVRSYALDQSGVDYDNLTAALVGARVKF